MREMNRVFIYMWWEMGMGEWRMSLTRPWAMGHEKMDKYQSKTFGHFGSMWGVALKW